MSNSMQAEVDFRRRDGRAPNEQPEAFVSSRHRLDDDDEIEVFLCPSSGYMSTCIMHVSNLVCGKPPSHSPVYIASAQSRCLTWSACVGGLSWSQEARRFGEEPSEADGDGDADSRRDGLGARHDGVHTVQVKRNACYITSQFCSYHHLICSLLNGFL
jgi:hypothetical protein